MPRDLEQYLSDINKCPDTTVPIDREWGPQNEYRLTTEFGIRNGFEIMLHGDHRLVDYLMRAFGKFHQEDTSLGMTYYLLNNKDGDEGKAQLDVNVRKQPFFFPLTREQGLGVVARRQYNIDIMLTYVQRLVGTEAEKLRWIVPPLRKISSYVLHHAVPIVLPMSVGTLHTGNYDRIVMCPREQTA